MTALKTLGAGFVVYVVMAACSAGGGRETSEVADTGLGGAQGAGGASALEDAGVFDPVRDASAAGSDGLGGAATVCDCPAPYEPPQPEQYTVPCSEKLWAFSVNMWASVLELPGFTASDMWRVHGVLVSDEPELTFSKAGYTYLVPQFSAQDGKVAMACLSSDDYVIWTISPAGS